MLISKRSYFIKAWYEWITDNGLTAYIIVDVGYSGVRVPEDYVENGRITLNISPQATHAFNLTRQQLDFEADFEEPIGVFSIVVPLQAIITIYAHENKQGAFFLEHDEESTKPKNSLFTVVEE